MHCNPSKKRYTDDIEGIFNTSATMHTCTDHKLHKRLNKQEVLITDLSVLLVIHTTALLQLRDHDTRAEKKTQH